jgi:AmpD protein
MNFIQKPSANYSKRLRNLIDMVVIHNISLPPKEFGGTYIEDFFQNKLDYSRHPYFATIKDLKVSAHLLINRDGEVVQFVDFADKAWHAGQSKYKEYQDINQNSIGIELEGADDIIYSTEQYKALNQVLEDLISKYPIKYIVGHSDIAKGRKTDPGESFQWHKLLGGKILDEYR